MSSRDRAIVLALVGLLVALSVAIGAPAFVPAAATPTRSADGSALVGPGAPLVYREGVIGRPDSINPLTARTQAARDLVALVFSGLVRQGPNGTLVPDLAESWKVSDAGSVYTFVLRPDARWHDGEPVTSADVAFTVKTLQDAAYAGPQANAWQDVTAIAVDERTIRFELTSPLGGFLQAATQPIVPEHLLSDVPIESLATDRFSQQPVGSGPYRLVRWDTSIAELVPVSTERGAGSPTPGAGTTAPGSPSIDASGPATASPSSAPSRAASTSPSSSASSSPSPTATIPPTPPPGAVPLPSIELHFYPTPDDLMADYRAGELDAASGLPPAAAQELAAESGSRLVRYPKTTYTGVVLNERITHPMNRTLAFRQALLRAIDRPALIRTVLSGLGQRADTPISPASWAFDPSAVPAVRYDLKQAAKLLKAAGWTKTRGLWVEPKGKRPYVIDLLAPDESASPTVNAAGLALANAWRTLGFRVKLSPLSAADFATRLGRARFELAVVDVDVGLDADLYPFFASTQTTTGGANVSGIQSPALDERLNSARKYASTSKRRAAMKDLQAFLGSTLSSIPLFFRDSPFVVRDRVLGPAPVTIVDGSGRYWDVLTWRLANDR